MMLSKLAHPLWFEAHHALHYFGVNYSAMAFMGVASVFFAHLVERLGQYRSLVLGFSLYSLALFLRIYHASLVVAALTGLIAGAGASIILLCFRSFIMSQTASEQRDRLIAGRKMTESVATIIAGLIPFAVGISLGDDPILLKYLILTSASIAVFGIPLARFVPFAVVHAHKRPPISLKSLREDGALFLGIGTFSLLCGAYTSFVQPFLFIILKRAGFDLKDIGLISLLFAGFNLVISPLMTRMLRNQNKRWIFLLTEVLLASVTLLIALALKQRYVVLMFLSLRAIFLSISGFAQESLEYDLATIAKNREHLVGLILSSFLIGDMLGGALGGFIAYRYNEEFNLLLAALMILLNGIGFYLFCQKHGTVTLPSVKPDELLGGNN